MKNALVLKLIDADNFIDHFTLFINFNDDQAMKEVQERLKVGLVVSFKNNIKTTISRNIDVRYALNYDKTTEINLTEFSDS